MDIQLLKQQKIILQSGYLKCGMDLSGLTSRGAEDRWDSLWRAMAWRRTHFHFLLAFRAFSMAGEGELSPSHITSWLSEVITVFDSYSYSSYLCQYPCNSIVTSQSSQILFFSLSQLVNSLNSICNLGPLSQVLGIGTWPSSGKLK